MIELGRRELCAELWGQIFAGLESDLGHDVSGVIKVEKRGDQISVSRAKQGDFVLFVRMGGGFRNFPVEYSGWNIRDKERFQPILRSNKIDFFIEMLPMQIRVHIPRGH